MTVSVAPLDAVIKVVSRASRFVIDSTFELCLRCFFGVDFVGLGMLHDFLSAGSSTQSLQPTGARSLVANSKRG